jgi:hypothetical protein
VPQLLAHIRNRHTILQEQSRKGVSHLMRTASIKICGIEDPIKHLADVRFIKLGPGHRGKHPFRKRLPDLEPGAPLMAPSPTQGDL